MHRVETDRDDDVVVIVAGGELDAYAAPELSEAFTEVAPGDRVVVDLTSVSFLDSTALGVVVRAMREIDERRGSSRIVLPKGAARRIFEITTLDSALPVAEDRADAVSALRPRA